MDLYLQYINSNKYNKFILVLALTVKEGDINTRILF